MSVIAKTMYVARCDYPGCEIESSDFDHGNNVVYDTEANLAEQFTRRFEGTLADDYGWMAVDEKHYCGDHVEWDDEGDNLVPKTPDHDHTEGSER